MLTFFLIVMLVTSLINIYAHWIADGLFGRLLYMAVALSCAAGIVHLVTSGVLPQHISNTLLILIAVKSVRHISVRAVRNYKYRRLSNAVNKR